MVYILSYCGALGRWALSAKQKMLKNKDLQSSPNPTHNYPGDNNFKESLKQDYPGLLEELEAFLTADVTSSSNLESSLDSPKTPKKTGHESDSIFSLSSGESLPKNDATQSEDTMKPGTSKASKNSQNPVEPQKPQKPQIPDESAMEDEEAALLASPKPDQPFAFDLDDSWDSPKSPKPSKTPEASDVLTVHAGNDFAHETAVRPARSCTKKAKRLREPSSTESSGVSPARAPSPPKKVSQKVRSVIKRLKPTRSASAAPLSPPTPVYNQKPMTLAQAKTKALNDKKFNKAVAAAEENSTKETKREALPNYGGLPLVAPDTGAVNPMVAENLLQQGRQHLLQAAKTYKVTTDRFIQDLLKRDYQQRSRSLSQPGHRGSPLRTRADPHRWMPQASPYNSYNNRGRSRVPDKAKKAATRQIIDGKPKNLEQRE